MRRVLVTGASGFIGGHIVQALRAHGFAVRCLVRAASRLDFIQPTVSELARGDVTDAATLEPALEGVDAVVHCAGITQAPSRREYFRVNEGGSRNLYLACIRRKQQIARIVHISSLAALGPSTKDRSLTEESPPHPISDYGESKLASQRLAESFMCKLPIGIVVPPAVYGPGDDGFLIYFKLVQLGFMPLLGREERQVSLIYVKDLADAVVSVLRGEQTAGKTYLVEDGCIHTWASVGEAIGHAMNLKPKCICLPLPLARSLGAIGDFGAKITGKTWLLNSQKVRDFLQKSWTCSSQRLHDELGFHPRYSLEQGVEETLSWYRKQGWL